eukprot:3779832-Amphidinium_carterae.2
MSLCKCSTRPLFLKGSFRTFPNDLNINKALAKATPLRSHLFRQIWKNELEERQFRELHRSISHSQR